ncbi:MAG: hypothetical protein ABR936_11415 [Bacteroidota bacterium]|jgi:hypothetical protein
MRTSLIILTALFCFSTASPAQPPDASVIIYQNTLNSFFNAIGPVSGKGQYNILGTSGDYTWTLRNARIELLPNQARFIADANIHIGPLSYGSEASGNVEVLFHPESNRISVKILQATFEVYFKIFGKKIHITDIDVAKYYKPEFEFSGPQPIQASVDVALPDGSKKTIFIKPVAQNLAIEKERIVVNSKLAFADHPMPEEHEHQEHH